MEKKGNDTHPKHGHGSSKKPIIEIRQIMPTERGRGIMRLMTWRENLLAAGPPEAILAGYHRDGRL
eukprot:5237392-Amphidinium_carterae.1